MYNSVGKRHEFMSEVREFESPMLGSKKKINTGQRILVGGRSKGKSIDTGSVGCKSKYMEDH